MQIIDFISFVFYLVYYDGSPFWCFKVIVQEESHSISCEQVFNIFNQLISIYPFVEWIIFYVIFYDFFNIL